MPVDLELPLSPLSLIFMLNGMGVDGRLRGYQEVRGEGGRVLKGWLKGSCHDQSRSLITVKLVDQINSSRCQLNGHILSALGLHLVARVVVHLVAKVLAHLHCHVVAPRLYTYIYI